MNGKKIVDKAKSIVAEYEKKRIDRAESIAAEYDISFMEALEVIKMVDTYFDNNLKDIVYYLKDIASSISYLSLK